MEEAWPGTTAREPSSPSQPSVPSRPSNRVCPCTRCPFVRVDLQSLQRERRQQMQYYQCKRQELGQAPQDHQAPAFAFGRRLLLCDRSFDAIVMSPVSPDRGNDGVRGACTSWPHGLFAVRCGQQVGTPVYVCFGACPRLRGIVWSRALSKTPTSSLLMILFPTAIDQTDKPHHSWRLLHASSAHSRRGWTSCP